jgi:hypothetical protein
MLVRVFILLLSLGFYLVADASEKNCGLEPLPDEVILDIQNQVPVWDGLNVDQRNHFLILYSKLKSQSLWSEVSSVTWTGPQAVALFHTVRPESEFRELLLNGDYGDYWSASRSARWGVRSRFRGAELHFKASRDLSPGTLNVHMDLHNPGDPKRGEATDWYQELFGALLHFQLDLRERAATHTLPALVRALRNEGIPVYQVCSTSE